MKKTIERQKALDWKFEDKYKGKFVIYNYLTYKEFDHIFKVFDSNVKATTYMHENDMWDDYELFEIKEDGYAYIYEL